MNEVDYKAKVQWVKDQCDPQQVIEELSREPVRLSGQNLKTRCFLPGHNDKTPSFNYSPRRGTWKCFGCGRGGDVIDLVMEAIGVDFNSAVSWLSSRFGFTVPDWRGDAELGEEYKYRLSVYAAGNAYIDFCRKGREEMMRQYMVERGQPANAADAYRLGFHPPGLRVPSHIDLELIGLRMPGAAPDKSLLEGRVIIPHLLGHNQPIAFYGRKSRHCTNPKVPKYLNSYDTSLYRKGSMMFNGDRVKTVIAKGQDTGIIVPEGQFDCMSAYLYSVAPGGTSTTTDHVDYARDYIGTSSVYLVKDGDAAGFKAMRRDIPLWLAGGLAVYPVPLPSGMDAATVERDTGTDLANYVNDNHLDVPRYMMMHLPGNEQAKIDEVLSTINVSPNTSIQRELLKRLSYCTSQSLYELTKRLTNLQKK